MTKQFTKGNPVWYVNKRTKKVYAGVYVRLDESDPKHPHIIYDAYYKRYDLNCVEDDCIFDTKIEAIQTLQSYLYKLTKRLVDQLETLTKHKTRINDYTFEPTEQENKAYKRLYKRYIERGYGG